MGSELRQRFVSAFVLAPLVLTVIYFGTPAFEILLTVAAVLMSWEWERLCGDRRFGLSGWAVALAILAAGVAAWARRFDIVTLALALGSGAAYAAARVSRRGHPAWISAGPIVVGFPCAALAWLRGLPVDGLAVAFWLVGTIWVTDVAAFAIGRSIGGARLASRISPRKTWSGLIGAVVGSALWGLACGFWFGVPSSALLALFGGFAAIVAQGGDLAVSFVKRRFGAKDTSNLIPGHGGVLDRLDGMLTAAPALAGLLLLGGGGIFAS